jgi:hypothetical protein
MKLNERELVGGLKWGAKETRMLRRWVGLSLIGLVIGLISGVTEAMGKGFATLVYSN